jgi:hypothetical protein
LSRKAQFFFPEYNTRLYDKNSESDYLFFLPSKPEYFFQQHWESEYFFKKKHNPTPLNLNGRSLIDWAPDLKASKSGLLATWFGSEFHNLIVLGKNEYK